MILCSSFSTPEKQVRKVVEKVWKGKAITLTDVVLPDSMIIDIPILSNVKSGDELLGYVAYTSSFGCRIGGCPGTSNPNAQSYETFNFIAVYDTDILIKKIEIVNYSGDYGYEICRPKWLAQFAGKNSGFELNKNIDGITGATVSATYLIDSVNALGKVVLQLKEQHIL